MPRVFKYSDSSPEGNAYSSPLSNSWGAAHLTSEFHARVSKRKAMRQQVACSLSSAYHVEAGMLCLARRCARNKLNQSLTNHGDMGGYIWMNAISRRHRWQNGCTFTPSWRVISPQNIGYAGSTGAQRNDGGQINSVVPIPPSHKTTH